MDTDKVCHTRPTFKRTVLRTCEDGRIGTDTVHVREIKKEMRVGKCEPEQRSWIHVDFGLRMPHLLTGNGVMRQLPHLDLGLYRRYGKQCWQLAGGLRVAMN